MAAVCWADAIFRVLIGAFEASDPIGGEEPDLPQELSRVRCQSMFESPSMPASLIYRSVALRCPFVRRIVYWKCSIRLWLGCLRCGPSVPARSFATHLRSEDARLSPSRRMPRVSHCTTDMERMTVESYASCNWARAVRKGASCSSGTTTNSPIRHSAGYSTLRMIFHCGPENSTRT
jgi:hypothetical protein